MLDCWRETPNSRPSFARLEKEIGALLETSDKNLYIEQCRQFESDVAKLKGSAFRNSDAENRDYLAMMSPPHYR